MKLAAVFAHPDDDTYGIGGTAAMLAEEGGLELAVIIATSGEAGRIADPSLAAPETLGRVREQEDRASWRALGVAPALQFLRHADGALAEIPREELAAEVAGLLEGFAPEVVVTFGADGVTGHQDHVAIGAAADEAFHSLRAARASSFSRLLHVALPRGRMERFGEILRQHGIEPPDPDEPFAPRPVPDDRIAVSVDASGVWRRKLEALRAHRTQDEISDLPEDLWSALLAEEHFAQAWPERPAGAPVLRNVFEGLPSA